MPNVQLAVDLPAAAQRAVADGRASAQLVRDGGGLAGRAPGCRQRDGRAQESGLGAQSPALRLAPLPLRLRLAVGHRRDAKGVYDVLLLVMFKSVRPPEEAERQAGATRASPPAK